MGMTERTEIVLGLSAIQSLKNSKVIVFGVGGVGGYVCEMLVRTGVGSVTIVDFDTVSESNLNRQIIATVDTVGKQKVQVMQERIKSINPHCVVKTFNQKLLPENLEDFELDSYDFVVDCIDMVKSKVSLIAYCNKNNINIISSMGTGNKCGIPSFKVCDLFDTKYDRLARVLRHDLKKLGVTKTMVVCTDEQPAKANKDTTTIGSVVYYPASSACVISAYVVNNLIKQKEL